MALQAPVVILSIALTVIAHAANIQSIYPNRGSTEGGTFLVISGSGFMMPVEANPWDSQVVFVGTKICNIHAHYTSSNRIVCETTPHDIPAESSESLTVSVQTFGGLGLAGFASTSSAFQYNWYDTPLFFWSDGWAGTGGDVVAFQGDVYPGASVAGQFDIRIGGARCVVDQENYPLSSRRRSSLKRVQCKLPDDDLLSPGHYNVTIRVGSLDREDGSCPNALCFPYTQEQAGTSYGYGMAAIVPTVTSDSIGKMKRVWGGSMDVATGQTYHYTIYPQVNAISPLEGSWFGGNNLTLTGSSFAADLDSIEVTVGGEPCTVLEATYSQIVCRLGSWQNAGRGSGMRGLMNAVYGADGYSRRRRMSWSIDSVPSVQDRYLISSSLYKGSLDSLNSDDPYDYDTLSDHQMRELTGFLVPPLTASYSFYICGDDQVSVEIGSQQGSPTETLQIVASSSSWDTGSDYGLISPHCWYYRQDLQSLPDLSGPTKKISEPIFLQGGMRYPFRLRHLGHGGSNFFRTGIKVSGLSSATTADGSMLNAGQVEGMTLVMPSMEVQAIRLIADGVLREKHWIELADVTQAGSFRIRITGKQGQESTMSFANSVDPGTVRDGVRDAQVIISGEEPYRLHDCRSLSVDTNETGNARRFTLTFNCPLEASTERWVSISIVAAGMGGATAGQSQQATAPLSGTFQVGHSGTWSSPIQARSATTSWSSLTRQIADIRRAPGHENGELELECWKHPDGWSSGESFQVLVRFRRPLGNVPLLEVNRTGLEGTGFKLEVYPVEDGDSDAIFIERVPADMFEAPYPADPEVLPVRLVVNGIVGGIGGNSVLGYKYSSALVPVLLSVTPTVVGSNGTLTLVVNNMTAYDSTSGGNWTKDVIVVLGDNVGTCEDTQEVSVDTDGITLTCVLQNVVAGMHTVHLVSITQGQADPAQAPSISVEAVVDTVSGLTGSLAGGTVLELTGVGLEGLPCSDLLVAGVACTDLAASKIEVMSSASLVCLTPALSGFDPSLSGQASWPSTSDGEITLAQPPGNTVVLATFTYESASTPLLSAVSPTFYSSALSTTITLSGSGFSNGAGKTALPIVQFGARMGEVTSQDDTSLAVWLIRAAPTPPLEAIVVPSAWIPGKGFAAVSGVTFESRFEVTGISPLVASKAGGVIVTITGAGFHPTNASKHLINFELVDGMLRPCEVLSGTPTSLTCRLKGGAKQENIETAKLYADEKFMRRLSDDAESKQSQGSKLRCHAGGNDHSKVRCFALAAARAGSLRSLPSNTIGGRTGDMLDWIRRSELEGDQGRMLDPVYNLDAVPDDAFVFGPDTEDGEPARRLEDASTLQRVADFQGLPRWGVASDEAEDYRLMHMRTKHFHGARSMKKSSEVTNGEISEDSDVPDLQRLLSSFAGDVSDDNSTNETDDSESKIEQLTLSLMLNGVMPTCKVVGGCGMNLTDEATPFVEDVQPLSGSYADGVNVIITVAQSHMPQDVQVFFGPFECPNPVVTSPKPGRWTITVPLCSFEASETPVYVLTQTGYAIGGSPHTGASFSFKQTLQLHRITASSGSFYGGTLVSISGAGLGPTADMNYATVGGYPCEVTSASNDQIQCYTPSAPLELADANVSMRTQEVKVQVLSAQVSSQPGLIAEYFYFAQSGTLPNLDGRLPDQKRIEAMVDHPSTSSEWFTGMIDSDNFAVRLTGFVSIRTTGQYTFFLASDDGSKLYFNGAMVIDNDGTHSMRTRSSLPIDLQGNSFNRITILHFEGGGSAGLRLQYSGPDTGGQLITVPSSALSHGEYEDLPTLTYTYDDPATSPYIENLTETGPVLELDGARFGSVGTVTLGTASNPSTNFQCTVTTWSDTQIVCTRPDLPSGVWQVRVHSETSGWSNPAPAQVWVDLTVTSVESNGITVSATTASEPWILVMKISQGGVLGYESELWTNTELLNPDSPEDMPDNAKYQAFLDTPFKRLRACVGSSNGKCVHHSFDVEWSSAKDIFSAGYIRDPRVDQAGLIQALGATPGSYRACPMLFPGFNVECPDYNKARWGFCANCPSQSCQSESSDADAAVGIGLRGQSSPVVGAGWTSYFASGGGTCSATSEVHRDVWLWVENVNVVNGGVNGQLYSGYGGGVTLTIQGSGLGFQPAQSKITVCGEPCEVSVSDGTTLQCAAPSMTDQDFINAFPDAFPSIDLAQVAAKFYTDRGEHEAQLSKLAFTSPIDQQIDMSMGSGQRSGCWFGFELPPSKEAFVTAVDFFPPTNPSRRNKVVETVFEVRSFSGNLTWVEVANVKDTVWTGESIAQGWTSYPINGPGVNGTAVAQAFRIRLLPDACESTGELMRGVRFRGILLNKGDASACPIEVDRISHPLASAVGGSALLPVTLSYSLARTPQVTSLSPNRGTARGDTLVTLYGEGLEPLDSQGVATDLTSTNAVINFNGYDCVPQAANSSALSCMTTERNAGINVPSTSVFLEGRGYAIISERAEDTVFRYVDRWSNIYSWLESEPPVDGDSVVVPEGQAIMLDQNSPQLFLLLISGYFEFDRQDLMLNSTYIWIAGGSFYVGSEAAPFLHQATITLHGDRWNTIELPVIGSKMLAVTDLGGLGTCAHLYKREIRLSSKGNFYVDPCPVKLVGRMELHGKPSISWTRLVETAEAGSSLLKIEEAVDWEVGTELVITPTERGQTEEVRRVLSIEDNGLTIRLDEPLRHEHLGIWYFNEEIPTPTDLRAAVGRLTRNVKVQGDERSLGYGNAYMFGVHIGAFHGGVMRIENTEITRSGQAANFGRYSSHWHVLSPHRTVDVVDLAYLRNNSYHHTFQRAVVVHSTDFTVVRDNVALQTKGHSYFTEAGDEVFSLYEHNLAVHPLQHPLLLDDDMDPAGFWQGGFQGWHRSNLASNCHRGWRVRLISGPAGGQTDMTFFNNSAHASGFGWHLKPPHAPPTLNNFKSFTAFRCNTGMFYYGTGNIFHDDHRFIECGTGHFMNHLSNNLHTAPFYHNLVLVGNIDPYAMHSRMGRGIRSAKDNEYFYVSGVTSINLHESAAFEGCFQTTCTMRYERARWFNSSKRTFSDSGKMAGIFWDLDGTLTGYPNGFVSKYFEFNTFPGKCNVSSEHVNGVVCGAADGSLRVRTMKVNNQEPWQLDGKQMNVLSSSGFDQVSYDFFKVKGWAFPMVENQTYDMRVNDPNDFQRLSLQYSVRPYVMEAHGYGAGPSYTNTTPKSEDVLVHLNYTDWRDHFDGTTGERLSRMPTSDDPFGSFSMILRQDQCDAFNLTESAQEKCGGYVNDTGLELKAEIDEQPEIPMVNGRLTTSLAVKVAGGDGSPYTAGPGTPTGGQFRQTFTPRECPKSGCPQPQVGVDGYLPQRRWSDAASWPDGKLPVAMDNVVLPPTDNVLLDIVTPKLHWVDIQGKLEFDRALNTTLNAHSLKVWGKLEMGTVDNPMPAANKAEIVLWGAEQAITVIMVEGLFLVNKVIAVLGEFSAVGTPRTSKAWTRLSQTAAAGATQLTVQGTVTDWPPGSQVAISATEYPSPPQTTETEVRTISAEPVYDAATDTTTLTLSTALTHRHFAGVIDSSAENIHWPQPFLAAAVALLDGRSNVVIRTGEEFEEHGGDVVIGGSSDGRWAGIATISNVDFIRMGKFWYQAPALKFNFLGGQKNMSRVENCVFSHSQSGAIEANYVSNLEIVDNVFHRTTRTAVWIRGTSSQDAIVLRRNVAIETLRHPSENTEWIRHFGAYYLEVRPAVLAGNVAAGSCDTGFILRPQLAACQKGDAGNARLQQEDLNEAVATMTGVFILDGCQGQCNDCAQVHGLVAWKSAHGGIMSGDQNANVRLDTILLADNHIGIALRFLRNTADMDHRTYSYNVSVYGSTPASTCDASIDCRAYGETDAVGLACNSVLADKYRRVGIMTHMMNNIPKFCEAKGVEPCRPPTTPIKMCVMPWEERMGSAGSRYSESHWDGITFGHWAADDCGRPSVAFTYNPTNIDVAYPQFFTGVVWLPTVEANAKVFLGESTITHNSVTATGEFDGVNQLVLTDVDGSLLGTTSRDASMVTVYNPALAIQSCTEVASSYFDCPDLQLRLLTWEAVGGPSHRVLSKFKAWRASDDRSTWSAGPQEEKACLPVGAEHDRSWKIRPNDLYNLTMFTSPPKNHRLFWFNDNPDETIRLDIFLTQPFRLEVYVDEVLMSEDLYDTAKKSPSRLPELTDPHGSYAFDPQARRFYLIMQGGIFNGKAATIGGGFISLRLLQVVQITMSVAIPLADFDSVEQNKFVNNVATLLQIPASRIKIVSVQSKAQVAAQGGRLLQVVEAVEIEVEDAGRNLQDEGVEVIFQVIEDETVSGGTGGPGADEFSGAAILELQSLIETLLNASETGTLSSFLGFNVVLESVELTDVPTDATDNTAGNSTVTQTTVTTTFTSTATTSTSTTDPNSTTEATEEPIEDPTGALVQSILIGAVVGIGVGVLMMIIGYLVRRRMYSRNVHASYSEGQQEALNP